MRRLPSSVAVLTTSTTDKPPEEQSEDSYDYKGMTISSFTTLSLSPEPLITFNIRQPSQTLSALRKNRYFLLHLLAATPNGARIADAFTRGNFGDAGADGKENKVSVSDGPFKGLNVADVRIQYGAAEGSICEKCNFVFGLPEIQEDAVRNVLHCKVLGWTGCEDCPCPKGPKEEMDGFVSVGDHVIVVARVKGVTNSDDDLRRPKEWSQDEFGLCYADGKYCAVGDVVDVEKAKEAEKSQNEM